MRPHWLTLGGFALSGFVLHCTNDEYSLGRGTSPAAEGSGGAADGGTQAGGAGAQGGAGGSADSVAGAGHDTGGTPGGGGGTAPIGHHPTAEIYHPLASETHYAGVLILFSGVASDPEDGALGGTSLVWTSDLVAGPLGTGASFEAALPAGEHVIRLRATDRDGNVGEASATLPVTAP